MHVVAPGATERTKSARERAASIDDVEGISERSIKLRAFPSIEVSDGPIIKILKRDREYIVAGDHARFGKTFVDTNLDFGAYSSNGPGDWCTGDCGQHGDSRIAGQHAHGASTDRRSQISPEDIVACYHGGAVRDASRAADRTRAASGGRRRYAAINS